MIIRYDVQDEIVLCVNLV